MFGAMDHEEMKEQKAEAEAKHQTKQEADRLVSRDLHGNPRHNLISRDVAERLFVAADYWEGGR